MGALIAALIYALQAADDDLDQMQEEIGVEKAELAKEIKKADDDERVEQAKLAKLNEQEVGFPDWLFGVAEFEKKRLKVVIAGLKERQDIYLEDLDELESAEENILLIRQVRSRERQEMFLMISPNV